MARRKKPPEPNAQIVRMQKLDADGAPVGQPVEMNDAYVTWAETTREQAELDVALAQTASEELARMEVERGPVEYPSVAQGAEFPQVAPVLAGNIQGIDIARLTEVIRVPVPTSVAHSWFPAHVQLPAGVDIDGQALLYPCKVYATPQGLYVYREVPSEREAFRSGAQPAFWSPIDYEETPTPTVGTLSRSGHAIHTAAGVVMVRKENSCGCGHPLKRWRPDWARVRVSWADTATLWRQEKEARDMQGGQA